MTTTDVRPIDESAGALPLVGAAEAAAGDEAAVAAGATWAGLMDRAARALADGVLAAAGHGYGLRVVVVVGKGNNGGDGWAAAPRLARRGAHVTVLSLADLDAGLSQEATAHRDAWLAAGGRVVVLPDDPWSVLTGADVVVDCLLGTGATGAPRGAFADVVVAIGDVRSAEDVTVVACDVPTGVDADTGVVHDPAVTADVTVTMGMHKRGLVLAPGCWRAGTVVVGDLGPHWDAHPDWHALTAAGAAPSPLAPDADKVAHGRVLVVAGSVGTAGAAILCTRAALGAGGGLVTLATPAHIQRVVAPVVPAAMTRRLPHSGEHVAAGAVDDLEDVDAYDAVVVGPGLGPVDGTRAVVEHVLARARRVVLDADAINVFRDDPAALADHDGELVLTPHQRELARIGGGEDGPDAWVRRVERVPELAARYDATIVAKGPGTLVVAPDGRAWVTPLGGPELGTGGSGDVLAGLLGTAVAPPTIAD
ncbi:NAD(P)H-hydrate dehydratase, partial [Salsipaludibacter albus]|uniref:NAD(P)H-hydrate dehydratase n=1 Tax=Salsipaludibacter albus TaxID=2849650 RepID=UPI001EE4CEE8|nr:NAD(P)H-hydrate dehydratase [Salsipaludibacter albus]